MEQGVICSQELPKLNNNILSEFCNFNNQFTWTAVSGGTNAVIDNDISGRNSYFGIGSLRVNFTGNSAVVFNSGGSQMSKVIQKDGNYLLSYAFKKSDDTSDITFTVRMKVNGVLQSQNTITQNLFNTSGFIDGEWNMYFLEVYLSYSDVIDFEFVAQSDTTNCYLYFDRMKLEINDRGGENPVPSIYTEAPLDVIEEENTIDLPNIPANTSITVTASLTGALLNNNMQYIALAYPPALITSGLHVHAPNLFSDNVVKFIISNPTGSDINPTEAVFNLKVIR